MAESQDASTPGGPATSDLNRPLFIALISHTVTVNAVVALARVTTSYRAIELDLSIVWLGVIAAAFAAFPIMIAVQLGRFIDRGHDALTIWVGSAILAAASAGFILFPGAAGLVLVTAFMGIGHIMLMASQQMLCVRAAKSPRAMESVFGNYMVAGAIGQGIGPYVVGLAGGAATVPPTRALFVIACATAVVSLLIAFFMQPRHDWPKIPSDEKPVPVADLLRVPGLIPVVVAGVIMISASDIILIYVPLLGAECAIDVRDIGLLLTARAAASMVARLFYARMVAAAGRRPLMIASTIACAASFAALAVPAPLIVLYAIMVVMGFSFGLATTLSITIVVDLPAARARGTANTLRIMGNRLGQFVLPFAAGLLAAAIGLSGLLAGMAAAIAASAAAMHWKRPVKPTTE
jgi:predicted MFS family arabinose efflux permease